MERRGEGSAAAERRRTCDLVLGALDEGLVQPEKLVEDAAAGAEGLPLRDRVVVPCRAHRRRRRRRTVHREPRWPRRRRRRRPRSQPVTNSTASEAIATGLGRREDRCPYGPDSSGFPWPARACPAPGPAMVGWS